MWIVRLALRRPYTFVVMALLVAILGGISIATMPVDIFPYIDLPVVSIVWQYSGLSPEEMESRIVTNFERSLTANVGWLGLQHVLENGGSGYFPKRMVTPHLKTKRLSLIAGAPEFSMPAYVVYPLECDRDLFGSAIEIMHRIADAQTKQAADTPAPKRGTRKPR